ncbi:MAG: hypothetical protein ACK4LQ_13960 [Pararhodobacter sp.]
MKHTDRPVFFMCAMTIKIPSLLHEVLGERQSPGGLVLVGLLSAALALLWLPAIAHQGDLAIWRKILAGLLLLDIAAGAVANLTAGTNAFYATRPAHRWGFIVLHIHLPVLAVLLGQPLGPYLLVWAYTIGAAVTVNLLHGRPVQRPVAGGLLCLGLMGLPLLALDGLGMAASLLFLFKVAYAFAVNHAPGQPDA